MRNIGKYTALLAVIILAASCRKELPGTWTGSDRLNFTQTGNTAALRTADTMEVYTFVFESAQVTEYTVWIDVETMGDVCDYPRPLKLAQAASYGMDAVPGVHYVAFDDSRVRDQYVIPSGEVTASVPVILLRGQLGSDSYHLRIVFEDNENFMPGYANRGHRTLDFSDMLSRPSNWSGYIQSSIFGTYSSEKHQFMFEITGQSVDEEYLQEILDTADSDYWAYLRAWFQNRLIEENQRREEAGEPLLQFSFNN